MAVNFKLFKMSYKCFECNKVYTRKYNWNQHYKKKHSKDWTTMKLQYMLNVLVVETLQTLLLPLPHNRNILEIFGTRLEPLFLISSKGRPIPAVASITIVNQFGKELVK